MRQRHELSKDLRNLLKGVENVQSFQCTGEEGELTHFILAREREQIARVVEPLRKDYDFSGKTDMWAVAQGQADDIEQSLAIADSILQEG